MENSRVGVVMRTKDRIELLGRALESVTSQSYMNWHLVVVNDGGERSSVDELVQKFAHKLKGKLTVLHNPRSLGMEGASNTGIRAISSDYVVIHDDDDSWHPDFLQQTVGALDADRVEKLSGVISHSLVVYEEVDRGRVFESYRASWNGWIDSVRLDQMLVQNRFPPISFLFRRDRWEQVGGFREDLPVLGDWDFALKLLLIGNIGVVQRHLAHYHLRERATGSLGNSVISGKLSHVETRTKLVNESVRRFISGSEANHGLAALLSAYQREIMMQLESNSSLNYKTSRHNASNRSLIFDPNGVLARLLRTSLAFLLLPTNMFLTLLAGRLDTKEYLRSNPDLVASRLPPWIHFCLFGIAEGRAFLPMKGRKNDFKD
jgi:glycosyltransferase involved in cell wall biosynthesis